MKTATSTTGRPVAAGAVAKPKPGGRPHSASRPQSRDAIGGVVASRQASPQREPTSSRG